MIKHYEIIACEIDLNTLQECLIQIENRLIGLENRLNDFPPTLREELLTRNEVAAYFKVNISTVRNWTNQGFLIKYGLGDRVYYKRSEIESALIKF